MHDTNTAEKIWSFLPLEEKVNTWGDEIRAVRAVAVFGKISGEVTVLKKVSLEMKHNEFYFKTFDGVSLYGRCWHPEEKPRAMIFLVHGLGEHSGRYTDLADRLTKARYVIFSFDLRGHGRSEGQRGHIPSYEALMKDIDSSLNKAKQKFPQLPQFLFGYSLGGNLVLNYTLRRETGLKGIIAIGPWLRLAFKPSAFKMVLGRITNKIWPSFSQLTGLKSDIICRDQEACKTRENDSLVHDHISARMFVSVNQAGQWALEHAFKFSLPLLIMQGGEDKLSSVKASREFAYKIKNNCTLKIWDGLYHEIHKEPEKEQVIQFLIDWLDKQTIKFDPTGSDR